MAIKFSLKTQAFYDEQTSVIPDDAEEITRDQHMALISGMNDGERRVYTDSNGDLVLSERKPSQWHAWDSQNNAWTISDASRVQVAQSEKNRRAQKATDFINSQQWPGKLALGRLDDKEVARFNLWLDYLDELENVDVSLSSDIQWPVKPE
ncbi:tail fiber assembly protein [Enterobacter roggenkampii]|uniref:tail fiber assembly protein n=1 Tax=Enterobacter roggenkampii TaxID=1812935 RepID=UPI001C705C34|nr:tail fiber assembly protein [Enterobacter roggenkampii]MBW9439576.1 hypothetical protein [Enterobacter roggenkampii]URR08837.1 tail fiber assembly protein [Enterobacter roggenkampii]